MRVAFCWSEVSGYMAACWRALQDLYKVDVQIISYEETQKVAFAPQVMAGLKWHELPQSIPERERRVRGLCAAIAPDVLVVPGWMNRAYRSLPKSEGLTGVPVVMSMDTPWRGSAKQHVARLALCSYLERIDHVLVPGERAYQYARRLGFAERQISQGLYGHDDQHFRTTYNSRTEWPRAFVFVGKYEKYKGLDLLVEAYMKYRGRVADPWALICCGAGGLKPMLSGKPGVRDLGFVQPSDLPHVLKEGSTFVLPSRAESWGVALAEACSSGVPVITTCGVGASVELVRNGYNGEVVASDSVEGLEIALCRIHELTIQEISEMGRRSIELAAPFGAGEWAKRMVRIFDLVRTGSTWARQ